MEHYDEDKFILASVNSLYTVMNNLAVARYKESTNPADYIGFCRNVMVNLMGNFVINKTDYSVEGSLQENIDYLLEDLRKFFEEARVAGKELQS